jgi:hypothetical protein
MHRALLCLALIGCYSPTYSEGLLCAPGPDPCPPGQSCFSGTCYLSSRDGAPDDTVDADTDADIDSGACVSGTFCLETTPAMGNLTGVWGSAADRIWVVGDQGVWSYNQGTWRSEPITGSFGAVHGASNSAVWAVATNGGIVFWDGTGWSTMGTGQSTDMRAVYALSNNEAWSAGGMSRAWHFANAPPWVQVSSGLIGSAHALAARDSSSVYLGGSDMTSGTAMPTLFRFEGGQWGRISVSTSMPMTFHAMWHSPSSLFIAGADTDSGEVFRYTVGGTVVSDRVSPARLYAIDGTADNDVWAAGSEGTVLKRTTTSGLWVPVPGTGTAMLRGVAAFPTRVWVVGDNARVYSLNR